MDVKDRSEPAHSEHSSDGNTNFASSVPTFQCADKNKSYLNIGSNSLPKVDVQTTRPCAVIGPDRVVAPLPHAADPFVKRSPRVEPWQFTRPPEYPHKMPEYAHKTPDYQQQHARNISPRQTFQENMPRIMVPPVRYNPVKVIEDPTFPTDKDSSTSKNLSKLNMPSEPKYCDVPYTVNPLTNEHKSVRNSELPVTNVDSVLMRSASHPWPPSGVNVRPPRGCGPELYHCPDYSSCAVPRTIPMNRPHRTGHEEALPMYPDSYYRGGNIRFEPYPTSKERYQQPPRYEFISNYSNPYNPPHFPSHKYDIQKLPTPSLSTHPYPGYPQVPLKYLEKMREPHRDSYQRSTNPQATYGGPFHNQGMIPNYGPVPGNCLQNKLYSYPADASAHADPHAKSPYETNKSYTMQPKHYQAPNNYYLNELPGSHHMKPQIMMPNYSAMNMHPASSYPYYRKETTPYKSYDFPPHYKNSDPIYNTQFQRISSQFSPNIISPMESHANDHTFSVSPEDCGYVSQSSTTSIRSTDSALNRYKVYDPRYGHMTRGSPLASRIEPDSKTMTNKEKKNINLRQFLQSWNEGDDEHGESNANKEILQTNSCDSKQYEVVNNQEQLYVLGLVNVPSEELDKYEHIQKVSKLPDNIKGYTSIDLLNQFEEAIESSKINNNYPTRASESKEAKPSIKTNAQMPTNLLSRPISPLDVEAKISQSVIHKEVGCNFELRPCSPKMMNVEIAAPVQNVSGERIIEKFANPLIVKSPSMLPIVDENCSIIKRQNRRRSLNRDSSPNVPSCKMVRTQYSPDTSLECKKTSYSIQDLESNSGVCLASLPRLDNEIELTFPEVNQQFINANKADPTQPTPSENLPSLDIEDGGSHISIQRCEKKISYPGSPSEEFSKLSKYRKLKNNKDVIEDTMQKPMKPIRTDSVIIKNPENSENITMAEEKISANEEQTFDHCDNRLAATQSPMNLAKQVNSPVVTCSTNSNDGIKVDTALNLIQTSISDTNPSRDGRSETILKSVSMDTSKGLLVSDLSDEKLNITSMMKINEPIENKDNDVSFHHKDGGSSEPRDKLDDHEEVFSLEQERRRQSLSLEAQLTPMSDDTFSDGSDSETDDASETKSMFPIELDSSKATSKTTLESGQINECPTVEDKINFEVKDKNEAKDDLSSSSRQLTSTNDLLNELPEKFSKSETGSTPNAFRDCSHNSSVSISYEQKSEVSLCAISAITEPVKLDHQSDDSDTDSISDSETSSTESTSEAEECSNTDDVRDFCDKNEESATKNSDPKTSPQSKKDKLNTVCPDQLTPKENKEILSDNSESLNLKTPTIAFESEPSQCTKSINAKVNENYTSKITFSEDKIHLDRDSISNVIFDSIDNEERLLYCADRQTSTIDQSDGSSRANDIDVVQIISTDFVTEKSNSKTVTNYEICHKRRVSFYKELFCAVFQHLILEEGVYDNMGVSRQSTTNDDTLTLQSQRTAQKSPTDIVEENLERMHASHTSLQDLSDEIGDNIADDGSGFDAGVNNWCDGSDTDKKLNNVIMFRTENDFSNLSENSQHENESQEKYCENDSSTHCENNRSKSISPKSETASLITLQNNSELGGDIQSKLQKRNENDSVKKSGSNVGFECLTANRSKLHEKSFEMYKHESEEVYSGKDEVIYNENDDADMKIRDIGIPKTLTNNSEKILCDNNKHESQKMCNGKDNLILYNENDEARKKISDIGIPKTLTHNSEGTLCDSNKYESEEVSNVRDDVVYKENEDAPKKIGDRGIPNNLINNSKGVLCDKNKHESEEVCNGKDDVITNENDIAPKNIGDVCTPKTVTNKTEEILFDNPQPDSVLHSINHVARVEDDSIQNIENSRLCESKVRKESEVCITKKVDNNLEETCDNNDKPELNLVISSENEKQLEVDNVFDGSSFPQHGIPMITDTILKTCVSSESEMHSAIDNAIELENDDVFERSICYNAKEFNSKPLRDPTGSREGSYGESQPETETSNEHCGKYSAQVAQNDKISDFELNNPHGCRRTTKRSLSESAIYSNNYLSGKEHVKSDELIWTKRKKLTDRNIIEETNTALLTSENLSNFMHSRRNSISSFYHDENGTFCILIDNDCILAQDEFDQEAICFADIPEENFSTVVDNHILAVNEPSTNLSLHQSVMDDEVAGSISEDKASAPLPPENNDKKTVEESWVEDVACVETVVSEEVVEDCNDIYENMSMTSPNCDDSTCDSDKSDLDMFSTNDHADKLKNIYGNEMCSSQSINFIKTLYTMPQMDVNKTLSVTESLILESTKRTDSVETANSTPTMYDESSCDSKIDDTDTTLNCDDIHSAPEAQISQQNYFLNDVPASNNVTKEKDVFEESKVLTSPDLLSKAQDEISSICESSNEDVFLSTQADPNDNCNYKRSSSSPEVSSTTEEKKSAILLKITNYKGSRISQVNDVDGDNNRRIRCKLTEENDYRSNLTSSRPLITKAAQKYIPPLKETTINDLKVKLFLPEQSLLKLKEIKKSKEQPKNENPMKVKPNARTNKIEGNKKSKPKFEDVLKSIDEIQIKMHKEKNKKVDKAIPKVIIKKNGNGSHYASSSGREVFNPDMTGRKWQPWVFLEKHKFIDSMAIRRKTRAVFCHRKGTYILAENFKKYTSMGSTKFIISQPKSDSPSGPLKYTIKLKQVY